MNSDNFAHFRYGSIALLTFAVSTFASAQEADQPVATTSDSEEIELIVIDGTQSEEPDGEVGVIDYSDEDLDTEYVEPQSQQETDEQELRRYFELYKEAVADKQYDEADSLAKRLVELAIRLHGLDSPESARALTNLGIVQYRNEEFDSAILNYQAAIDIIERIEDRLNSSMMNPLKGLGAAYLASGRPDLARQNFDRAVHISHVNEGPHNLQQVEVLDALSETYISVGEIDEALDMQKHIYNLQTRKVEANSELMVPALERQASWMHRLQFYNRERVAWRKLIRVLERNYGKEDLRLVDPLVGLGNSYLYFDVLESEFQSYAPTNSGETYLKRALRIAEASEDTTWQIQDKVLLSLADFYTLSGRPNRAKRTYTDVWNLLSSEQDRLRHRYEELERINILQENKPPQYYNSELAGTNKPDPSSFDRGTVVVGYSVSAFGATNNIHIIEAQPPGLPDMQRAVAREVRHMVLRPRMEDGFNVRTDDQIYTHEFFYHESDLEPIKPQAEVAADQEAQ